MKNMKTAEIVKLNTCTAQTGRFSPGKLKTAIIVTGITTLSLIATGAFSQKSDALQANKPGIGNNIDTAGYVSGGRQYLPVGAETMTAIPDISILLKDLSIGTGSSNVHTAIIDIFDRNTGKVLKKLQIAPGESKKFTYLGLTLLIVCFDTFPGFTLNEKSADLQTFTK